MNPITNISPLLYRLVASLFAAAFGMGRPTPSLPVAAAPAPVLETSVITMDDISGAASAALEVQHVDTQVFAGALRRTAELVVAAAGGNADLLTQVWSVASPARQRAVLTALAQVGLPYQRNGASPAEGFDCSGLTLYAWAASGVELDHNSEAQIGSVPSTVRALPGDLVQYPGHIMMALGFDHLIVHSVRTGQPVSVGSWGNQHVRIGNAFTG